MKFTKDQEDLCQGILNKNNYYDILGITQTATQDQIKKAYRSLALKLHPDKNQAPSASEAFKKINKAFACLSDEEKRKIYDQTGQESQVLNANFSETDFAEHVFREFFHESFNTQAGFHRVYRTEFRFDAQQNQFNLCHFLGVIFLVFLSYNFNFFSFPEVYSFTRTKEFSMRRYSQDYHVEYYVDPDEFRTLTREERLEFDMMVESDYYSYLEEKCEEQINLQNIYSDKAKHHQGETRNLYKGYAQNVDMRVCEEYYRMKNS